MISIVIPAYNAEKTIKNSIDSVIASTIKDLEIIVVDDESTDNTYEIVKAIEDDRIKIYQKKNIKKGAVSAYLYGLKVTTGKYIYMLDADDTISNTYLEQMLNKMNENNVDLVSTAFTNVNKDNNEVVTNPYKTGVYNVSDMNIICNKAYNNQFSILPLRWNKLFKKEYVDMILDDINENLIQREDNVFNYLYFSKINSVYVDNENTGYFYKTYNDSVTRRKDLDCFNKMKESTYYLFKLSNNKIECARLMLDNVTNVISKSINEGTSYRELKPIIKEMVNDELVRFALNEKSIYSTKEKLMMSLIKHKHTKLLFDIIKLLKKLR